MAAKSDKNTDAGQAEVQEKKAIAEEKGYHGVKVDPTPNEHYTVPGQLAGKPTPETHTEAADTAAAHTRAVARGEVND